MKKQSIYLIGLCVLSLFVRLYPLPTSIQWQDMGTELLSAYHAGIYHEFTLLGVHAASIQFYHPPWYFWALGVCLNLIHDHLTLIYLSALFHALTIIPVYALTVFFGGPVAGILSGVFYALYPSIVELAWTLQSQNIIVPIVVWIAWLWFFARKKNNLLLLSLSGFLWIGATTVNYAAWSFAWVPFLITLRDFRGNFKRQLTWISLWIITIGFLYTPLYYYFKTQALIEKFTSAARFVPQTHHMNIFLPFVGMLIAIGIGKIYSNKQILIIVFTFLSVFWIQQSYILSKKGDYRMILSCAEMTAKTIRNNNDTSFLFTQIDATHTDNWSNILYLIESSMNRKLVHQDTKNGLLIWDKTPGETEYILCLQSNCAAQIDHMQQVIANPDYPCALYKITQ